MNPYSIHYTVYTYVKYKHIKRSIACDIYKYCFKKIAISIY